MGGPVGGRGSSATAPRPAERTPLPPRPIIAGRVARLVGGYFDLLVVSSFFALADLQGGRSSGWWPAICWALYAVPSTAASGRTFGKLAVGTRVVALRTLRPPRLTISLLRWAVLAGPTVVLHAAANGSEWGIASLATAVVVAPILWDVLRRGLHDRAAGTVVIRTR